MISAGIHPHFQGLGWRPSPSTFKAFSLVIRDYLVGAGLCEILALSSCPTPSLFLSLPSTPPLFPVLYIELSVQSKAISQNCVDGILPPIKAKEPFSSWWYLSKLELRQHFEATLRSLEL